MAPPLKIADRILQTTVTAGTGAYVLASPPSTAVRAFLDSSTGLNSGDSVPYIVQDALDNPSQWEVVEGIVTAGAPATLSRVTVRESSSQNNAAVNWPDSATKYIICTPNAKHLQLYGWTLIGESVAASSATLDFVSGTGTVVLDDTYDEYELRLIDLVPATGGGNMVLRVGTSAGGFITATQYAWAITKGTAAPALVANGGINNNAIPLNSNDDSIGNSDSFNAVIRFCNPDDTTSRKRFRWDAHYSSAATLRIVNGAGDAGLSGAIDRLRVFNGAGNIASGGARLYALRK